MRLLHALHVALFLLLLLSHAPSAMAAGSGKKKKGKTARTGTEKTAERPFTQKHPQQPRFQTIKEEDISPEDMKNVRKIKEGEILDLSENARKEAEREQPKEVHTMFDAVMSDEFASINKALVEDKIDVNIRGPNGYTPLFQAVFSHKLNAVHMLLEAGAEPRLRNNQGFNALDAAAYGGCVQCVHMLLKDGRCNPALIGRDGYNALHRAIWGDDREHTEVVEMLLEAGLSPSKAAVVPGSGTIMPLDMVNENADTHRVLKRAIDKEEKRKAKAEKAERARAAEKKKADALFGTTTDEGGDAKKDEL